MKRSKVLTLAVGLALALMVAATGASGDGTEGGHANHFVRWDLVLIQDGLALVGGTDTARAANGHTIALTGSGQVEPSELEAAGGGTFVHRRANGTVFAHGVYRVTGFVSWRRLTGGNFGATGLTDGIGNPSENEPTSGVLKLRVRFIMDVNGQPGQTFNGRLTIFCHLPETTVDVPEGIRVVVPAFDLDFRPHEGVTIFHRLR